MRRFFLRKQVTPYVILFIERDGSTYLTSLLISHPHIEAIYERFAVLKQKNVNAADQLIWAKTFFTPRLINRYAAVGFKAKLVDILDLAGFTSLIHEKKVRIIHMQRRNQVKAVVSRINARRLYENSGNWNLYKEVDRMPAFEIDPLIFAKFLQEREQADDELTNYVDHLNLPVLKILYEDLLVNRDKVLAQVLEFLRVKHYPVKENTLKHTSDDLRDVILNYDHLRALYLGTRFENMFSEVLSTG